MLLIPCPWCGNRAETEFFCAGQVRPPRSKFIQANDEEWIQFLSYRDNKAGVLEEYWWHEKGCGEWFTLCRNNVTHDFVEKS